MIRWAGHVEHMWKMRTAYNILVGKPEGKRLLRRTGHILEDNIKLDYREMSWEGVHWIHLAQDTDRWWALVNTAMNVRTSYEVRNFLTS
jgi:hypothetical protein